MGDQMNITQNFDIDHEAVEELKNDHNKTMSLSPKSNSFSYKVSKNKKN